MGRQPGEQVEDPLQLAGRLGRREHREALLGAVVAGRGEPERRPLRGQRPGDGRRDDEQRLDLARRRRDPSHSRPRPGLDVEGDQDLAVARRLEAP